MQAADNSPGRTGITALLASLVQRFFAVNSRISARLGHRWVQSDRPLWEEFERTVAAALREVPDGGTFVDVGGGRSCVHAAAVPKDRGVQLVAVDISADELEQNAAADRTVVADVATGLPFQDGEIDLLVSRVALEHVSDVPAAVRHMARAVRPGGRTVHFVPGRYAIFAIVARVLPFKPLLGLLHLAIPHSVGVIEFDVHYDRTDPVALAGEFEAAGFSDVQVFWTAAQADYFKPFVPAFLLVAAYQSLVRVMGVRRLAAYVMVDARR